MEDKTKEVESRVANPQSTVNSGTTEVRRVGFLKGVLERISHPKETLAQSLEQTSFRWQRFLGSRSASDNSAQNQGDDIKSGWDIASQSLGLSAKLTDAVRSKVSRTKS